MCLCLRMCGVCLRLCWRGSVRLPLPFHNDQSGRHFESGLYAYTQEFEGGRHARRIGKFDPVENG